MIRSFGKTDVGRARTNNEDSFRDRADLGLFVVADGMGGAQAGERASQIAADTIVAEIEKVGPAAEIAELVAAVELANFNVRAEARAHPELAGMGTTIVAVIAKPPRALVVNVGDSRAYLQTDDGLYCVTTDHSWVNEVGRGLGLTDEQLRTHPYRNVLTKAIGAEDDVEAQALEVDFMPGDILLLCSDGLHGVAGEQALLDILQRKTGLEEKGQALIQTTLDRGAPDNVTVVLVERLPE